MTLRAVSRKPIIFGFHAVRQFGQNRDAVDDVRLNVRILRQKAAGVDEALEGFGGRTPELVAPNVDVGESSIDAQGLGQSAESGHADAVAGDDEVGQPRVDGQRFGQMDGAVVFQAVAAEIEETQRRVAFEEQRQLISAIARDPVLREIEIRQGGIVNEFLGQARGAEITNVLFPEMDFFET